MSAFWIVASGVGGIAAVVGVVFTVLQYFSSQSSTTTQPVQNRAGDLVFRAGDGGPAGKGGDLQVGPGNYKAGDAVQINRLR